MRPMKRWAMLVVAVLTGVLVLAACSSSSTDTSAADPATVAPETEMPDDMNEGEMMSSEPFGEACSAVPTDGAGSFDGMMSDPVATAASNNPALSSLVGAVDEAGLVDTLNSAEGITVFAPTNDAFAAVPKSTLKAAMKDPSGLLTDVLTYHVVAGELSPEDLAGTHETLQGESLEVTGSGEDFTVNGSAAVVCGNVHTANATVYIIDGVLLPPAA